MQDIAINGKPLAAWHCKMKDDWAEQRDQYSGNYLQPSQAQRIIPISSELPIKTISFTLDYLGTGREVYRAKLELLMLSGTFELVLPGRPAFTMWMTKLGAEKHSRNSTEVQYNFVGYQHGIRKFIQSNTNTALARCDSTTPKTPLKITLNSYIFQNSTIISFSTKLSDNGTAFNVSQEYLDNLKKYDGETGTPHTILIDGELQKFEVDGQNVLSAVASADFPYFVPGTNVILGITPSNFVSINMEYTPIYL